MANTEASLDAFFEQIRSGKMINDKQIVYNSIKKFPGITLMDLKRRLKISHQTVSARLSDLMDMGVVEVVGTQSRIGMVVPAKDSLLKVQEDRESILLNKNNRSQSKFKRAVKMVLTFEGHISEEVRVELNKLIK